MLKGKWARVMGLVGASSLAALLLMVALVGLAQAQEEKPPPVENLKCEIESDRVRFSWDIPEWSGGEIKWYDLDVTLPNGNRFIQRNHWMLRSRTDRGNWQPGSEARISVKALYDVPGGKRVTSEANGLACVVPGTPNRAPAVSSAIADATIVSESGAKEVSLAEVFSDADGDDLAISATSSAENVAKVSVSADYSALTVAAKSRGTATITVTASDGNGGTVEDAFTATVKSAPVVASAIADVSELEVEATREVSLTGVFSDADGDALTIAASSSDEGKATVTVAADGSNLTLTGVSEGTATVAVAAEDTDGNRVSDAFDVAVVEAEEALPPNSAPSVSSAIADATIVSESETREISLSGVFSDADGDALTVTASSSDESIATVSIAADYSALTVSAKSRGTVTITVTASDGNGGAVEDALTVTVKSAPVVATAIADVSGLEVEATHQVSLTGVFSDADGEALTITASSSDEGKATVTVAADGSKLTLTGVSEGTATVTVTAEDTDGNRVSDALDVAVVEAEEAQPPNSAPVVSSAIADATIVSESGAKDVSLVGVYSDADNDVLTVTASSSDDSVATVSVSADYSALTVAAKSRGTATITVTASDGNGGTVEDTFTATVKSAPVVASAIADVSELEIDATHQVSMSGVFSDADGDALAVTEASSSDSAVAAVLVAIDGSTAAITGITVIGKDEGTATITVTARDSDGNGVSDAFDVTVPEAVQLQRTLSSDATLNGLSLSGYTLNGDPIPAFGLRPAFASATTEYAASAPQFTAWVRVTATAADSGAAIQVDGQTVASGAPSQLIRLVDNQAKRIAVTVTAADGATRKTYTVMATSNPRADLRALSMSPGELWPRVFSTSDKTYSAWLPHSVESVRVTATGRHGGEALTVNGNAVSSGQPSPDIALDVGENLITVVATAPDGYTTSSYTIAATRLTEAQSSDATLSGIKVYQATSFQPDNANNVPYEGDPLTIAPAVSRTEREYQAEQPEGDGIYVAVAVTTNAPGARSIVIDGPDVNLERRDPKDEVASGEASGPWQMSLGYQLITITVTSPDGKNTETYRLVIKRGTVDDLKGLRLSSGDGSLTLSWEASDSPTAPTDYMLRWRKAGETTWLNRGFPAGWKTSYALDAPYAGPADGDRFASVSHGSATLSGLENGVAYEVQARGARGPLNPGTGERRVFVFLRTDWQSLTGTPSAPKQPLTITPSSPTREYGADDDLAYSVGGLLDGDVATDVVTGALSRTSGEDAGDYAIGMGALAVASAYAAKYSLPAAPSVTTYTITPRPVTAISGVTVTSRAADGTTDATFDTAAAGGTGVLASELADFRAGGLQVSGTFPSTAAGAHDVSVTYSLRDQGSFKAANYSLSATSATLRGEITSEATELPGPVTGLELSATFDSVTVNWSAPESGGAPRGYIAHLRPEGGSEGSGRTRRPGADKTTATFDNLESSRTYLVWVRAQNEAGKGERVHASITLPTELPGPVTGLALTATEGAADSVTVSWQAPETGGAPDGYIAHLRLKGGEEGSGRTKTPKASKTQVTFGNLESGATYKVWVRAENEAGKGERVQAEITLLTITPLTITPNNPTREYGETDDLGYAVGGLLDGDVATDVVTGTLSRAAGDDAGDYAIGIGTLAVASAYAGKYSLPAAPSVATYTITPRPVTAISGVTVASRAADGTTDATFDTSAASGTGVLAAELANFRAGGLQVSGAFPSTAAGAHDVSVTYSLQDHGSFKAANYSLSTTTATLRGEITASTDELVCVPAGFKDTTDDPDLANIYTLADLDAMREDPGKGYELMADLDFDTNGNGRADAGDAYWNGGAGWDHFGLDGVFDGNGHTISNLYVNNNRGHPGLFDNTARDGEVRNLRLESVDITTSEPGATTSGLVAHNKGKIIDVYVTGSVSGWNYTGGLVGINDGEVVASSFSGSVTAIGMVGGLVGSNFGPIVAGCSSGSVTNTAAYHYSHAGGLVGSHFSPGYVIASHSFSSVTAGTGTRFVGGLLGRTHAPVTASYATGPVSGGKQDVSPLLVLNYTAVNTSNLYWDKNVNSHFGYAWDEWWYAAGRTTAELQAPTGYTGIYANWNVDLDGDGSPDDPWDFGTSGEYPTLKYSGLDNRPVAVGRIGGTDYDDDDDGLIEISSLAQLNAVRWDVNGDGGPNRAGYRADYAKAYPDPATAMGCPQDGCVGYELTSDLDFDTNDSGAADAEDDYWNGGSGWTPIQDQGLAFRAVFEGNGHTISNLYINDASSDAFIGLFRAITHPGVARNVGLVSASVTVVNDNEASGALAGMNAGEISGAYMTGSVSGSHAVGGLVGFNNDGGRIAASYAAGRVSGNGRDVGGLVAFNDGEIASSYAMVSVEGGAAGAENVGGLVGYNESGGVIRDSYAAGAVSGGGANVGGLVGFDKSRVSASYWDTETTGQASSAAGAGKTTAELQEPAGYAGIYADWNVDLDGDGSADDPWDFGTSCQYPVLKFGSLNPDDQREPCEPTPEAVNTYCPDPVNDDYDDRWHFGFGRPPYDESLFGVSRVHVTACVNARVAGAGDMAVLSLSLPEGVTIDPEFSSKNYSYRLTVPAELDHLTFTGRFTSELWGSNIDELAGTILVAGLVGQYDAFTGNTEESEYSITIATNSREGNPNRIELAPDAVTMISIEMRKSRPGETHAGLIFKKSYTLAVVRSTPREDDATLRALTISKGSLNFDPAKTAYAVVVRHSVDSVTLTPTPSSPDATVTVDDKDPATPVELDYGKNVISVKVIAADGVTTKTYTVTVTRLQPSPQINIVATYDPTAEGYDDAALRSLSLPHGVTMVPEFQSDHHSYRLTVPAEMERLAFAGDFNPLPLIRKDEQKIKAFAILVAGDLAVYEGPLNRHVNRGDAYLIEGMTIANSHLGGRGAHTIALPPDATTVIGVGVYKTRVGHTHDFSGRVPGWSDRKAVYTLEVTRGDPSEGGTAQSESTTVPPIADVSGLVAGDTRDISLPGVFSVADRDSLFVAAVSSDKKVATVSVSADYSSLTVTGVAQGTATIVVMGRNGNRSLIGSDMESVAFRVAVETRITLPDVTDLSDLTISDGSLTFDRATTSYTVNVGHSVSSVTLTPATSHTDATVTVDGGDPAAAVSLNYGANVIAVVVTAPDGVATKTYTVTVNRALPLKPGPPQNARVESSADAITATWQPPTSGDGPSRYVARLRDADGGAEELRLGADARRAVFDGLEAGGTYTVGVRAANDGGESEWAESEITLPLPAALSSLIVIRQRLGLGTVAGTNLISDPAVTEYEIELSEDDLYLTLRPTAQRPGTSTITVNGSAVASGGTVNVPRPGRGKTKVESIVVREGGVERIYTLTVKRGG